MFKSKMAVAQVTRGFVLVLLFLTHILSWERGPKHYELAIQALYPRGLQIFLKVLDGSKLIHFKFNGRIISPYSDNIEVSIHVREPVNDSLIYDDPCVKLRVGDVINYSDDYLGEYPSNIRAYMLLNTNYTIRGHIPCGKFAFLMKKKQSPNCESCDMIQDVQHLLAECVLNEEERKELIKKHGITRHSVGEYQPIMAQPLSEKAEALVGQPPECRPTVTRLRSGTACAGQTIFEDDFRRLCDDVWQVEQYIPDQPEYPFVSYQRPPHAETIWIDNGYLRIEPKLQQEQNGFSDVSLYTGTLDLFNGCTRTAEACFKTAMGASILPPVVSGRLTSKSFAFMYGVVEVRAKLPQGDWLYPEILLEPLIKKYGIANYASGVIKIASALGNRDLCYGHREFGNMVLYGGAIMNSKCREVLMGRKELFNESRWGDDFHVYSVRWTPDRMTFSVDGMEWLCVEPSPRGLSSRFNRFCDIPRMYLHLGSKMAPFDDYFQLTLGVAAGGVTEFKDDVITGGRYPKPWQNRKRKASYNFWRNLPAWRPTWSQPALLVDYVKVTAL